MTTLRTAAHKLMDAMEKALRYHGVMLLSDPPQDAWKYHRVEQTAHEAITALKAALAEPQQEPVAWYLPSPDGDDSIFRDHRTVKACTGNKWEGFVPLYTAPPQRKPLTEEEILNIFADVLQSGTFFDVARAIEAAHGIKP